MLCNLRRTLFHSQATKVNLQFLLHALGNSKFTASRFNVFDEQEIHDKIYTHYNGIDVENYFHGESKSKNIHIGTSSQLVKYKPHDHILGALKVKVI